MKSKPYAGLLTQIGLAVVNLSLIPVMLAGQAWVMLPDCYKGPLIDLLLDGVIGLVQAAGSLPGFGPLWGMLQSGILGFLQGVRNQDTESKVKITNKLATILSGGSPDFIIGFVKGLGKGLWEGLTDPFQLAWDVITGIGNLTQWLVSVANQALAPESEPAQQPATVGAEGAESSGEQITPEMGSRMREMASELQPPVEQVGQGFMPALQEAFRGGEGLTYEGLMQKLGEASAAVESAIQGAGDQLAQKLCEFLLQDNADGSMGESVGWLAGMIAFEVVLGILTAGTWTGWMKAAQAVAKVLDWTGEALGVALRALAKVGGYLLDGVKALGRMVSNMGGAVKGILDAVQEIGEKLIRFGEELLGLAGRQGAGEVAEEGLEKAARETTEATAERSAREGADDPARKAAELPQALAEAKVITETNDVIDTPPPALIGILNSTLRSKYPWIRNFEARSKNRPGHFSIHMIASDHKVSDYEVTLEAICSRDELSLERKQTETGDPPTRRLETDEEYMARLDQIENSIYDNPELIDNPDEFLEMLEKKRASFSSRQSKAIDLNNQEELENIAQRDRRIVGHWKGQQIKVEVNGSQRTIDLENTSISQLDLDELEATKHYYENLSTAGRSDNQRRIELLNIEITKKEDQLKILDAQQVGKGLTERQKLEMVLAADGKSQHVWFDTAEEAENAFHMLEEMTGVAPNLSSRPLNGPEDLPFRGPEKHLTGEAGPRHIHYNAEFEYNGESKNIHIYFPDPTEILP